MTPTQKPTLTDLQSLKISQPAHRALAGAGIKTLAQLARRTEAEVLALHGIGPSALPILNKALKTRGLAFKAPIAGVAKRSASAKAPGKATTRPTAKKSTATKATPNTSAASAQIDAHIAGLGDWRGTMIARFRKLVRETVPNATEEFKWGSPVWSLKGNLVAAGSFKDHVKLNFFKGAGIGDPHRLFNAGLEAKGSRGIDLFEGDALNEPALRELLQAAVALNAGGG